MDRSIPAGLIWGKSTFCNGGTCAEVAQTEDYILIRDSKDLSGPVLSFSRAEWKFFTDTIKAVPLHHF